MHSLEKQWDAHFARSTLAEKAQGHVCMSEWFASKQILVAYLYSDVLGKFPQFLNRYLHVLHLPVWIFATVNADS